MVPAFPHCESHPGRLLRDHLLDVARRVESIADRGSSTWLAGLFHDVGKATSFFQEYLQGNNSRPILKRHADLGALWLVNFLANAPNTYSTLSAIDRAVACDFVRRHHGRLDDLVDSLIAPDDEDEQRFALQLSAMDTQGLRQWLGELLCESVPAPATSLQWTAMRVRLFRELAEACTEVAAMIRFLRALQSFGKLIEADRDSAAGYSVGSFESPPVLRYEHVERFRAAKVFGPTANPLVTSARERVYASATAAARSAPATAGHLWSLTVPTGAGKTLAAIGWATKRREARIQAGLPSCPIIYALPFTSVIDQNAAVLRKLLVGSHIDESVLAVHHHLAELGDLAKAGEESLARSWVEGWRADIVCTTFVQVVSAMFHATCSDSRRLLKLAGSILVLDEVQAFPAELWPVLRTALTSLAERFGTDVLLVTATQPALFGDEQKIEIGPARLSSELAEAFDRYDLCVELDCTLDSNELAARAHAEAVSRSGRSLLIIVNTVQESLDLYAAVAALDGFGEYRRLYLSTNLRPKDRRRILTEVAECASPVVLVSTQVVEAGIDLSFDLVIRALAPIDAIIQAAGRCNRHGNGPRGHVLIVSPVGNSGVNVYGPVLMSLAKELLDEAGERPGWPIREPELAPLVREYFLRLAARTQTDRARKTMEAIQMLEFAALRGEGTASDRIEKRVELILDRQDRIPHFVETDDSDVAIWSQLVSTLGLDDARQRHHRLRSLRREIGERVVEVPLRHAFAEPDDVAWLVRVPLAESALVYDSTCGWRRSP